MRRSILQLTPQLRKVLSAVRFDARNSVVQIAKRCGLPAHTVRRCIDKLNDNKVLTPYVVVNVSALGFNDYGIFITREHTSQALRKRILTFLMRSSLVPWIVEYAAGEYQYAFSIVAHKPSEVDIFLLDLGEITGQSKVRQSVVQRVKWHVTGERAVFDKKVSSPGYSHGSASAGLRLDQLDWRILRLLSAPRISTLRDLAQGLGEPLSTIEYRLKSLEREGVILSYSNLIDVTKFGLSSYHILISERRKTHNQRKQLVEYLTKHSNIVSITTNVGEWECECELVAGCPEDVAAFENELYEHFPVGTLALRCLEVLGVHKLQPLPASSAQLPKG